MVAETIRKGGCLCRRIRYTVRGDPYKSGLCHCADCRKVTGAAFLPYADWRPEQFEFTGEVETYRGRSFCPRCGSRLFSRNARQVEKYHGILDSVQSGITPIDEDWIIGREPW